MERSTPDENSLALDGKGAIRHASGWKRALLAALGIVFVGIAAIGVLLPGIPTVGPLLVASLFLLKSSPRLERRLIRNRFFARYLPYLDGSSQMSFRARMTSIGLMWASICLSCLMLRYVGNSPGWVVGLVILAGMVGTIFILRFGKSNSRNEPLSPSNRPGGCE